MPTEDSSWSECLRDLKRTLEGGRVFVVGRRRCYAVKISSTSCGDVSRQACEAAFAEVSRVLGVEMSSAGAGPSAVAAPEGGNLALLARRVAASISVAPGMQVVLEQSLPPALWQPIFAVCLGRDEVRVLTVAFAGEAVAGDRPSCKRGAFLLKVLTEDLASLPGSATSTAARYTIAAAPNDVATTSGYLQRLEPQLFEAAEAVASMEAWNRILGCASPRRLSSVGQASSIREVGTSGAWLSRTKSVPAGGMAQAAAAVDLAPAPAAGLRTGMVAASSAPASAAPPASAAAAAPRQIGDRAARMRATFERARSPGAAPPPAFAPAARSGFAPTQPRLRSVAPAPAPPAWDRSEQPKTAVSVLADGLSVKSIAGAWNSMAASTGSSLGEWLTRARSPTGFVAPAAPDAVAAPARSGAGRISSNSVTDRHARIRATLANAASQPKLEAKPQPQQPRAAMQTPVRAERPPSMPSQVEGHARLRAAVEAR